MARNKSSKKAMVWNYIADRFEPTYINPTKAGRLKSRATLKRKKHKP